MADERVNRKDGESRVCKRELTAAEYGEGKEIYEFAVTAMALAYSPTFFRASTEVRENPRRSIYIYIPKRRKRDVVGNGSYFRNRRRVS